MTHLYVYYSYYYEDERGIFPETQYLFDIELPNDFVPKNADGEMQNFQLLSIDEVGYMFLSVELERSESVTKLFYLSLSVSCTYILFNLYHSPEIRLSRKPAKAKLQTFADCYLE